MKVKFSPHAKQRMTQRNIGKSVVLQTVNSPDRIDTDTFRGTSYVKKFDNKVVKVPFVQKGNDIIIKSVFYIKK